MGINPTGISSSGLDRPRVSPPNPDPSTASIVHGQEIDNFLLVWVRYPGVTTFEGIKLLVFEDVSLAQLHDQGAIDPHFSDSDEYSHPVARFEPTDRGVDLALAMCQWAGS